MPTIAYIGSIQIRIYYDDHGRPHFLVPVIAKGPVFAALRDGANFATTMPVADDRLGLEWRNRVDLSADGLRIRAFPEEATTEFGQPDGYSVNHAASAADTDGQAGHRNEAADHAARDGDRDHRDPGKYST